MKKKILLMYISNDSGHHKASMAIEEALYMQDANIETMNVNSFNYTNPVLEKIINKTYMSVIRRKPEFWGYLYDNPEILKRTQGLRDAMHKHNAEKLNNLISSFSPHAVVCTQAFPCGMVADYKRTKNIELSLFAVLTDYAPHSYWIYNNVDAYFVPSRETGKRIEANGILQEKIIETGIPISPSFKTFSDKTEIFRKLKLNPGKPVVLMMGGSQGFGPLKESFMSLLRSKTDFQIITVAGNNKSMFRWFKKQEKKSKKKLLAYSYVDSVKDLMEVSTLLISKPGGITISEAFVKALPICIIQPIPGQEQMNSDYLIKNNVAVKIDQPSNTGIIVEELLYNRAKLAELSRRAQNYSRPDSAEVIAQTVLSHIREV